MKTKRKVILSLCSLFIVAGGTIGLTFGVLAARNQAVRNEFNVSYTADNVSAVVSATYQTKLGEKTSFKNGDATEIEFKPKDDSSTAILTADDIVLTSSDNYVIFTYKYKNTASVGGEWLAVEFKNDSIERNNLITTYYCSNSDLETYDNIKTNGYSSFAAIPQKTVYIEPQGSFYFYIMEEIADISVDAGFSATSNDIEWGLSTLLGTAVPQAWFDYVNSMLNVWSGNENIGTNYISAELQDSNSNPCNISVEAQFKTPSMSSPVSLKNTSNNSDILTAGQAKLRTTDNRFYEKLKTDEYVIIAYKLTNNETENYLSLSVQTNYDYENGATNLDWSAAYNQSNVFNFSDTKTWRAESVNSLLIAPASSVILYQKMTRPDLGYEDPSEYAALDYAFNFSSIFEPTRIPKESATYYDIYKQTGYNHKFATVSADYTLGAGEPVSLKNGEETEIYFYDLEEGTIANENLRGSNVSLTKENPYVVYKFMIKNENIAGGYWLNISYEENIVESKLNGVGGIERYLTYSTDPNLDIQAIKENHTGASTISIPGQETAYIYQLISLEDSKVAEMSEDEIGAYCYLPEYSSISVHQTLQYYNGVDIKGQHDTSATISATLQTQAGEVENFVNFNGLTEEVYSNAVGSAYLSAPDITLSASNQWALYKYKFVNTSQIDIGAVINLPSHITWEYDENFNIVSIRFTDYRYRFLKSSTDNLDYDTVKESAIIEEARIIHHEEESGYTWDEVVSTFKDYEVEIPYGETKYLYVIVENVSNETVRYTVDSTSIEMTNRYTSALEFLGFQASCTGSASYICKNGITQTFMRKGNTSVTFTNDQKNVYDYLYAYPVKFNTTNSYVLYKFTLTNNYGLQASARYRDSGNNEDIGLTYYYYVSEDPELTASQVEVSGEWTKDQPLNERIIALEANQTKYFYMLVKNTAGTEREYNTNKIQINFELNSIVGENNMSVLAWNVEGTMSAAYMTEAGDMGYFTLADDNSVNSSTISLPTAESMNEYGKLYNVESVSLNETNTWVAYKYSFTNTADTIMAVTFENNPPTGVSYLYYKSNNGDEGFDEIMASNNFIDHFDEPWEGYCLVDSIESGESLYFYVIVTRQSSDVDFAPQIVFAITDPNRLVEETDAPVEITTSGVDTSMSLVYLTAEMANQSLDPVILSDLNGNQEITSSSEVSGHFGYVTGALTLSETNPYVIYRYAITNNSTASGNTYMVECSDGSYSGGQFTFYYATTSSEFASYETIKNQTNSLIIDNYFKVQPGETVYYYVLAEKDAELTESTYMHAFSFNIYKAIASVSSNDPNYGISATVWSYYEDPEQTYSNWHANIIRSEQGVNSILYGKDFEFSNDVKFKVYEYSQNYTTSGERKVISFVDSAQKSNVNVYYYLTDERINCQIYGEGAPTDIPNAFDIIKSNGSTTAPTTFTEYYLYIYVESVTNVVEKPLTYTGQAHEYQVEINGTTYTIDSLSPSVEINGQTYAVKATTSVNGTDYDVNYYEAEGKYGSEVYGQVYTSDTFTYGDQTITVSTGTFDVSYYLLYIEDEGPKALTYSDQEGKYQVDINGTTYTIDSLSPSVEINGQTYAVKATTSVNGTDYDVNYYEAEGKYGSEVYGQVYTSDTFTYGDQTITVSAGTFDVTYYLVPNNSTSSYYHNTTGPLHEFGYTA